MSLVECKKKTLFPGQEGIVVNSMMDMVSEVLETRAVKQLDTQNILILILFENTTKFCWHMSLS
jgi:hypothetical protein